MHGEQYGSLADFDVNPAPGWQQSGYVCLKHSCYSIHRTAEMRQSLLDSRACLIQEVHVCTFASSGCPHENPPSRLILVLLRQDVGVQAESSLRETDLHLAVIQTLVVRDRSAH